MIRPSQGETANGKGRGGRETERASSPVSSRHGRGASRGLEVDRRVSAAARFPALLRNRVFFFSPRPRNTQITSGRRARIGEAARRIPIRARARGIAQRSETRSRSRRRRPFDGFALSSPFALSAPRKGSDKSRARDVSCEIYRSRIESSSGPLFFPAPADPAGEREKERERKR